MNPDPSGPNGRCHSIGDSGATSDTAGLADLHSSTLDVSRVDDVRGEAGALDTTDLPIDQPKDAVPGGGDAPETGGQGGTSANGGASGGAGGAAIGDASTLDSGVDRSTGGGGASGGGASGGGGMAEAGGSTGNRDAASGGILGAGGNTNPTDVSIGSGGTAGIVSAGGINGSGGAPGSGGISPTGGALATGGAVGAGGVLAVGGTPGTGGVVGTGGTGSGGAAGGTVGAGGAGTAILGATPPMGWSSWNTFGCTGLSESLIRQVADTLVSSGMRDTGYVYVNIDDCWMDGRDANGSINVSASKFPSGMKALGDYVHGKGLRLGLYSSPGPKTCTNIYGSNPGGVGSQGHEVADAQAYASWGVDYLKYDKCTGPLAGFATMRDALGATGRPIFYAINPGDTTGCLPNVCSIPVAEIANSWRIGFDINASWGSFTGLIDIDKALATYAGPGHWNDPDTLMVGRGMSIDEDKSHFSMWAILAAPLITGNDIRTMSADTKAILTNAEVIAIDQDPLGMQGTLVATPGTRLEVWSKTLSGTNTRAVALFNRTSAAASITVTWSTLGIPAGAASVRDLWTHTDLGTFTDSYTASSVPSHGLVMLKVASVP